jgi:hypothetical protein
MCQYELRDTKEKCVCRILCFFFIQIDSQPESCHANGRLANVSRVRTTPWNGVCSADQNSPLELAPVYGFGPYKCQDLITLSHFGRSSMVEYTLSRPAIQSPHRKQEGNRKAGRSRTSLVRREMPACRLSERFEDDGEKQVPRGHGASALSTATLPIPLIPECGTTF